jgi:hypothetical protein
VRPAAGTKRCYGTLPPVQAKILLRSRNDSGERGVASITFGLHQTRVVIRLTGAPKDVRQQAHLHGGGCRGEGPLVYDLGPVVNGRRDVKRDEVPKITRYSVDIHASTAKSAVVVACGATH